MKEENRKLGLSKNFQFPKYISDSFPWNFIKKEN